MAGKKKQVPRQSRKTEPRTAKTTTPRWGKVLDALDRSMAAASPFLNEAGNVDTVKVYAVAKKYGGKKYGLELTDPGSAIIFRPNHVWKNPDGTFKQGSLKTLGDLDRAQGKTTRFYDMPMKADTRVKKKAADAKWRTEVVPHPTLPHVRVAKTIVNVDGKPQVANTRLLKLNGRLLKTEGEAKLYSGQEHIKDMERRERDPKTDPIERDALRRQLRDIRAENAVLRLKDKPSPKPSAKPKAKPVVIKSKRHQAAPPKPAGPKPPKLVTPRGAKHDGTPLSPSQYLTRQGYVWTRSAKRKQEMEAAAARRQQRANRKQAQREYAIAIRNAKHQAALRRRRIKEQLREPARRVARIARTDAATRFLLQNALRGKGPMPLALKKGDWTRTKAFRAAKAAATAFDFDGRGKNGRPVEPALKGRGLKRALRSLPHSQRYPAVGHSSATPMPPPVSMAAVSGKLSLTAPRDGNRSRVAGTKVLATQQTVPGRGGSGTGVFFRINAEAVLANLTQRYPQAMAVAAKTASSVIGRKLLDIVEPYVPKDTGLMYTTARDVSGQTADGLVDIDGAEPYPSSQMFGVSITYNTPYAEDVYFDPNKAHGAEYNRKHNTSEKGEKEQYRWIEAAFREEGAAVNGLMGEYAQIITAAFDSMSSLQGGHITPRHRKR